jgi:hypothetical protein
MHTRPRRKKSNTQLKKYLSRVSPHVVSHVFKFCIGFLTWPLDISATDDWMDQVVNKRNKTKKPKTAENPFEEFDRFFGTEPIPRDKCLDIISWFGVGLIKAIG